MREKKGPRETVLGRRKKKDSVGGEKGGGTGCSRELKKTVF